MNGNGKMDLMLGGDTFSFANGKGLDEMTKEAAVEMHNKAADAYTKGLEKRLKDDLKRAEEITEKMSHMEIMPSGVYILCKPYAKNPYQKIEVTNSGLIIPEYTGRFKNPDSGEEDMEEQLTVVATVLEV